LPGRARHARGVYSRGAADAGAIFETSDRGQDRFARSRSSLQAVQRQDRNPRRRADHLSRDAGSHGRVHQVACRVQGCMGPRGTESECAQPAWLRPTIRAERSELWASWNPRRKSDAIDDFLRTRRPDGAVVVNANWRDNPWFPAVLDEERRLELSLYPPPVQHILEGDYFTT